MERNPTSLFLFLGEVHTGSRLQLQLQWPSPHQLLFGYSLSSRETVRMDWKVPLVVCNTPNNNSSWGWFVCLVEGLFFFLNTHTTHNDDWSVCVPPMYEREADTPTRASCVCSPRIPDPRSHQGKNKREPSKEKNGEEIESCRRGKALGVKKKRTPFFSVSPFRPLFTTPVTTKIWFVSSNILHYYS